MSTGRIGNIKRQNATTVKDGMGVSGNDRCDIGHVPGKLDSAVSVDFLASRNDLL